MKELLLSIMEEASPSELNDDVDHLPSGGFSKRTTGHKVGSRLTKKSFDEMLRGEKNKKVKQKKLRESGFLSTDDPDILQPSKKCIKM